MPDPDSFLHMRVLVLLPTSKDVARTVARFQENGLEAAVCTGVADLCRELRLGAGAVLLTDDALLRDDAGQLAEVVRAEPAWSSVPFVVLARDGSSGLLQRNASTVLTNLTIVERPVRMHALVSLMASVLRGRQQQYVIRDALQRREQQAEALRVQEERARFALAAGGLGSWDLDLATMEMSCSDVCKTNYGRPLGEPFSYRALLESIHPDDRAGVVAAIQRSLEGHADYDVEHRCCWPNGEIHWMMVRGRVVCDDAGKPQRMVGVALNISERKRMYQALQQSESALVGQAERLRSADRLKDEFLATLAHELRNPLAPIRTGMDLLRVDDPESQRTVAMIGRQLAHMVRLIDDLLDVSRITRGKLELKRAEVALTEVIELAVESSRPLIDRHGHVLQVALPSEPLTLDVDLTRMAQVIGNLLNNACKYTPPGGLIELSAERVGAQAVIRVRDNGVGIPSDQLENIFQMFNQINRQLDRSQGGLGIGLALVRQLVEMHGGSVTASSAGAGSLLEIILPLASGHAPLRVDLPCGAAAPAVAKRILVVDDNDDAAEMLAIALRRAGHPTTTACDGPSALSEVELSSPHVVFLDIGLPGMSGYDVARALRSDPRHGAIALIALTGWGSQEDRTRAAEAGFDLHLTKPVNGQQLREALVEVESRRAR